MIKGMLFNTEMVKAILAGRKTQTRRLVKERHLRVLDSPYHKEHSEVPDKVLLEKLCELPYQSGDVLYVRETWCENGGYELYPFETEKFWYKADEPDKVPPTPVWFRGWHPSIHMPKEAARIFLRVTGVRVERLQDVTLDDAIAEGCQGKFIGCGECVGAGWEILPEDEFADVWNRTIKKSDIDKYGWDANPYIWCISFERITKEEAINYAQ